MKCPVNASCSTGLGKMLARVDAIDADIAELDARIEELIVPFAQAAERAG